MVQFELYGSEFPVGHAPLKPNNLQYNMLGQLDVCLIGKASDVLNLYGFFS